LDPIHKEAWSPVYKRPAVSIGVLFIHFAKRGILTSIPCKPAAVLSSKTVAQPCASARDRFFWPLQTVFAPFSTQPIQRRALM